MTLIGPTFGGITLEDIKAPECFIIEQQLKEVMDIPVFHDDQHASAVIYAAGLINALHISGMKIEDGRIVLNGAGAAGIACFAARDRHVLSALMLAHGHGDDLVTGATRKSAHVLELINHVFDADADAGHGGAGVTALLHKGRIALIVDTLVHEWPDEEDLANIARRAAGVARHLGPKPRVAFVSFRHSAIRALNGPANILVVSARHSALISVKLMQEMAAATVIGPILSGVDQAIRICSSNDILNMAVLAACKVG